MEGVVTGWGVTVQYGAPSNVLNEVTVPILSNKECRTTPYGNKKITDNMMCAGFPEGKKDSCQVSIFFGNSSPESLLADLKSQEVRKK
jgi:hypothetical protein